MTSLSMACPYTYIKQKNGNEIKWCINMNNDVKALKSGVWYTVSYALIRGISYLTIPIFTRILSKEAYGIYTNYTSLLAVLTVIVTLNLASTMVSARYDYADTLDDFIFTVLLLSSLSVTGWTILFNIFWNYFELYFGIGRNYLNIMMLYLLFLPAVDLYQARERSRFEYKRNALISILISGASLLLPLLLLCIVKDRLTAIITGMAAATILTGSALYLYFSLKKKRIKIDYWKYALPICLPYIPHLLSLTILNSTDKLMITYFCGAEKTAVYGLSYSCGMVITLLLTAINMAYGPWLAEKLVNEEYQQIREFSPKYINCFFVCGVAIMLISPEILWVLGGQAYMEAIYVMPPIALGCIYQFLYTMFVNVEQCRKKTVGMAIASVSAAFLNLVLNYIFIPRFGYMAAAYTTLAGYLWLLLVHMWLVARMRLAKVYSYKQVLFIVGLGLCIVFICNFLYRWILIRYVVLLLYGIVLMIFIRRKGVVKKVYEIFSSNSSKRGI